jgi:CheY-like chemotaxis protein
MTADAQVASRSGNDRRLWHTTQGMPNLEDCKKDCAAGSIPTMATTALIVEDDDLVRAGLRAWLAATFPHWRFLVASTGEIAVYLAQRQAPDIVLMDIGLPGMNGIEPTRRLKAMQPEIQVVMLSIHEDAAYRTDAGDRRGQRLCLQVHDAHGPDLHIGAAVGPAGGAGTVMIADCSSEIAELFPPTLLPPTVGVAR